MIADAESPSTAGFCSARPFVAAGSALPGRVSHVPRPLPAGHVAAAWRANDAPIADTRDLGSTADSTAEPDTAVHTPCEGKSATPAAGPLVRRSLAARLVPLVSCSRPMGGCDSLGPPGEDVLDPPRALPSYHLIFLRSPPWGLRPEIDRGGGVLEPEIGGVFEPVVSRPGVPLQSPMRRSISVRPIPARPASISPIAGAAGR